MNLSNLNESQKQAVMYINGHSAIIAGAGTGKTHTLLHKILYLLDKGVSPSSILFLTFTKKAAEELNNRISTHTSFTLKGGTFHSFCNGILRKFYSFVKFKSNFTIIDQADSLSLLKLKCKDAKVTLSPGFIQSCISKSINLCVPISDIFQNYNVAFSKTIQQIVEGFKESKLIGNTMDYDDLLFYAYKALGKAQVKEYCKRYKYVIVDEMQDTSILQFELLKRLNCKNITVVGDPSQSIYSFRGANYENIDKFKSYFKSRVFKIETNYRSTTQILDVANAILKDVSVDTKVKLRSNKSGVLPIFKVFNNEFEQAFYVRSSIQALLKKCKFSDIAVLFRNGSHSSILETELIANKLPFIKRGGRKFYESSHIKSLFSFLRLVKNKQDFVAWIRFLSLIPKVGEVSATKIYQQICENNKLPDKFKNNSYLTKLKKIIDKCSVVKNPNRILRYVKKYYIDLVKFNFPLDHKSREKDINLFYGFAKGYKNLDKLLFDIDFDPNNDTSDKLILSTIHSSKGLEWKYVFLINVMNGCIPSSMSKSVKETEEEERLFYVGVTRAKDKLIICQPSSDQNDVSPFLANKIHGGMFKIDEGTKLPTWMQEFI